MKCSHGLAYELKCRQCVSEALLKEKIRLGLKIEPKDWVAEPIKLFQLPVDRKYTPR
jgi:hypothetical protein